MAHKRKVAATASCGHEIQLEEFMLPQSKAAALEWIKRQMSRPCGQCRMLRANSDQAVLAVFLNALGSPKVRGKRYSFPPDTTVSLNRDSDGIWTGELRYMGFVAVEESDSLLGLCRKLSQKHLERSGLDKAFL